MSTLSQQNPNPKDSTYKLAFLSLVMLVVFVIIAVLSNQP